MNGRVVRTRKNLALYAEWLRHSDVVIPEHRVLACLLFVMSRFALLAVMTALFFVELPLHLQHNPITTFGDVGLRDEHGQYLESYSSYVRRMRTSVAMVMLAVVAVSVQFFALGYGIYTAGRPQSVNAYSTSIDINPSWDDSVYRADHWFEQNPCTIDGTLYSTKGSGLVSLTLGRDFADPLDCDLITDYTTTLSRPAMKFSLAGIPNNATVTGVNLLVNVSNSTPQTVSIMHPTSDAIDTLTVSDGTMYNAIDGTEYTTASWGTVGAKNVALGGTAVSDVQSRITGSDTYAIGLKTTASTNNDGAIDSVNHGTVGNRPILRVTYTVPPQAPSATNHSTITTSSIVWTWTDNATADTRYDVHNPAHANVTGCTNLAANSQSCTETGLSANTQYTRHPNVTDPQGNTDGPSASAYTAVQAISSVGPSTASTTSVTAAASVISNLGVGLTAVYYEDITSGQNSGWITTLTWTENGLQPNTKYQVRAKSRNGDGVETAFSPAADMFTLALEPDVIGDRTTSTWYTSGDFTFTNNVPFGAGGIEYYRYVWDTNAVYNFDESETVWNSGPLVLTASSNSASWYLHVLGYDQTDTATWSSASYGPYFFDATAPTTIVTVNDGLGADSSTQSSTTTLSANWTTSTDATSGLARYEYAIGTTSGGINVVGWTTAGLATSATKNGLSLTPGATYYITVRGVDQAGNLGIATNSNGITIDIPTATSISGVSVMTTTTTATITWTTNESASGMAEYGLTTAYGSSVNELGNATSHSATITGLSAGTAYQYRLTSVGTTTATTTGAFTTASEPTPDVPVTPPVVTPAAPKTIAPAILQIVLPKKSTDPLVVAGIGRGSQIIRLYIDGKSVTATTLAGSINTTVSFRLLIDRKYLTVGKHSLTAKAKDRQGTVSAPTTAIAVTVAAASDRTITAQKKTVYVVQPGDSLWSIADQFLGQGSSYTRLIELNVGVHPSIGAGSHTIQPGWTLRITSP